MHKDYNEDHPKVSYERYRQAVVAENISFAIPINDVKGLIEVVLEKGLLADDEIDAALDVRAMTEPGLPDN